MSVEFTKVTHKIINKNGWSLWLPSKIIKGLANFSEPDIYAESTTQLYPLGTKLEFADGRVFRYGKWGATSTNVPIARMAVNANAAPSCDGYVGTDGFEGNCYTAGAVGDEHVDLWTIIAAGGTGYRTTVFAENFFEDGMLVVFCDTGHGATRTHTACYRICGSDVTATPITRVYLDAPLKTGIIKGTAAAYVDTSTPPALTPSTGGTGVTAYPSLFSQLKDAAAEGLTYTSAMGVCHAPTFTEGSYGWIQRAGLCDIAPYAYIGDAANERDIQLNTTDGTVTVKGAYGTHRVGYLPTRTVLNYGDLQVWLQLE